MIRRFAPHQRRQEPDNRPFGRSPAERALGQIRLLAVALLLLGGAGYRPAAHSVVPRSLGLPLAGAAVAVLLLIALLVNRAESAQQGRRSLLAGCSTAADSVIVLGVVWLAGLPPHSFALVLLMLPLLEAALWFGLVGLGGLWTLCSLTLGALVVSFPHQVPDAAISTLIVAMPTLLLATIPVALLAEHLVAQVGRLIGARQTADDRARLLGDLSAITADMFPLDADAVLDQLVHGAAQLGADAATVSDPTAGRHARQVLVGAGDLDVLDGADIDEPDAGAPEATPDAQSPEQRTLVLRRELAVPGDSPLLFTAALTGAGEELLRRTEAMDLLVAQGRVALANAVLVAQLEQMKQTYQEQATRDQLTGLLNRRGLVARAQQLPGRLGVLFCDLDGFKGVNDTLGHAAGDELLVQVARRLERETRSHSVLGRLGGDEFVLVVPDATDDDLAGLTHRLEVDMGRPFLLEAGMARIGASIGVAHSGPGERDLDALLSEADHLMYEVKRNRKNTRNAPSHPVAAAA